MNSSPHKLQNHLISFCIISDGLLQGHQISIVIEHILEATAALNYLTPGDKCLNLIS